jgi:hypothetical protein
MKKDKLITIDYLEYLELEAKADLVDDLRSGVQIEQSENFRDMRTELTAIVPHGDKLIELLNLPTNHPIKNVRVIVDSEEREQFRQRVERGYYRTMREMR